MRFGEPHDEDDMTPSTNPEAWEAKPYPYQHVGAKWLASLPTAFLGDDMGIGKSYQAIRACDIVEARAILVLAPTNAIYNWRDEFHHFALWDRPVQVVDTGSATLRTDPVLVVVTTHGLIRNTDLRRQMVTRRWDALIVDEAQFFKHHTASRTQALYGPDMTRDPGSIAAAADRVWLLSGTPIENHAGELWTHVRALRPGVVPSERLPGQPMTYDEYVRRYCITVPSPYGLKVIGNKRATLTEIRDRIIKPFVLRRRLPEVLPDLPPIRFDLTKLPLDSVAEDFAKLESDLGDDLKQFIEEMSNTDADPEELLARLASQEEVPGGLSRLRRMTGILKVRGTLEILEEHFAAYPEEKVILFAYHLSVVDEIVAASTRWQPAVVTGSVSALDRHAQVKRFQTDPACKVFVGQIRACATAATLTAANQVLFVEPSWVPAENAQAAARARRIGQRQFVRVQLLALAGSLDEAIVTVLTRKVRMCRELLE